MAMQREKLQRGNGVGIDLREHNLMQGVLALVVSLSEIIKDALKIQSLQRMRDGGTSEEELERWKLALMDLDAALDQIRANEAVTPTLQQLGRNFDDLVDHILNKVLNRDSLTPRLEEKWDAKLRLYDPPQDG